MNGGAVFTSHFFESSPWIEDADSLRKLTELNFGVRLDPKGSNKHFMTEDLSS